MITLTITGETMKEVMDKLSGYGFTAIQNTQAPAPAPIQAPVVPTPPPTGAPFAYTPVAVASPTAQIPPAVPVAPPPPPVPTTQALAFTLDQITRAGADLITTKPELMGALMAMLPKYGVQTLAALKPDQFGSVATELRTLGANI